MKKKLLLILFICVICAAFILIGGSLSGDPQTLKKADENKKIQIGVFEPLTGYLSTGGQQEALGLEYAQSVRPTVLVGDEAFDIEFVLADNESEENAAKNAARHLVDMDVSAVLGSFGCSVSAAGGEVFAKAGIPAIGISCTNPTIVSNYPQYFQVSYSDDFQGKMLASFAHSQGYTKAAVMTQAGDLYSKGLGEYFSNEFIALGGEVVSFSFNNVQMNFVDLISEIRAAKVDCVFMPSAFINGSVFISQARTNALFLPVIGADNWDTEALITELGIYGAEVYFSSQFAPEDVTNIDGGTFAVKYAAWVSGSEERLEKNGGGTYAASVTALAYDAYMLLCDAIEAADSWNPSAITAQLRLSSYSGVTGEISFSETGAAGNKTAYIKSINIVEGRFSLLKTYFGN